VFGLPPEKIEVTTVYAGGSFGRRANKDSDYVVEACALAKQLKKPLKVVWTREDDTRGGYYRPKTMHRITAGLDAKGRISGWDHKIVGQGVMDGSVPRLKRPASIPLQLKAWTIHLTRYRIFSCSSI
jgi:isoquinoline 1-oxidoreductase beta subunit